MKREVNHGIFVLIGLFVVLNVFGVVWAEQQAVEEPLIIESDSAIYSGQNEMALWPVGQVESILEEESLTKELLNVIVYIQGPDLEDISKEAKAPFSSEIESLGERLRQILGRYRAKVSLPPEQEKLALITQEFMITEAEWVEIFNLRSELDNKLDEKRGAVGAAIKKAVRPNLDAVAAFIAANGGKVVARVNIVPAIGAVIPRSLLTTLAKYPLVLAVMKDRPTEYELNVSMPSAEYDTWWNAGYDGGIWDFGIVDSGVQENHPAFTGIAFFSEPGSSVTGDHGTHVTGIVASGDATYRGGAYGLDAIIWANSGPGQAGTMLSMGWMASTPVQKPEVVNHSLGYGTANATDYSNNDSFYDAYIYYYDILVTKSCGNGGWNDINPTITHPAPAYNLLAVANMDDKNTLSRSDDVRRSSSSVGPTVNGRKKPDITAPGTYIMSTNAYWSGANPDFISKSGTSMSAPHVAAAIVLMEDAANHNPIAQKAILINTADAWTSNNTSTTADDGAVSGSHWDKSYGWGYIDMWEAHFNRSDYFASTLYDKVVPRNDNATPDDYKLYKGHMYANEKATMVWEKRSNYVAGVPPTIKYSLSDLNIRVYNEADNTLLDSDMGGSDNVHQVAVGGSYDVVIKAYAWSMAFSGATEEYYALATEENFQRANPPSFNITLTMPAAVPPGTTFGLTVNVQNTGDVAAHNNQVTLTLPAGFSIVLGANPQSIGKIAAGATGQATWSVKATTSRGTYSISATNSSSCYLEIYTGSGSRSITTECLSKRAPEYRDWVGGLSLIPPAPWSKPDCWCYPRQCRGDIDGKPIAPGVPMYVSLADLVIFRKAVNKMYDKPGWPAGGICADLDHKPIAIGVPMRVSLADLVILRLYINKMDIPANTVVPICNLPPVYTGPYNFWTSP